jgi:hypothetical protein
MRVLAPTYSFVGASTITTAATVSISGVPTAGTNATITNAYALLVESGGTAVGADLGILVSHADNTNGSSNAVLTLMAGGPIGGDPKLLLHTGSLIWSVGADNNFSGDPFKIGFSSAVGTNTMFQMAQDGTITFQNQATSGVTLFNVTAGSGNSSGNTLANLGSAISIRGDSLVTTMSSRFDFGSISNADSFSLQSGSQGVFLGSTAVVKFSSNRPVLDAADLAITRSAASVLKLTNASTGLGALIVGSPSTSTNGLTINTVALQTAPALIVYASDGTTMRFQVTPAGLANFVGSAGGTASIAVDGGLNFVIRNDATSGTTYLGNSSASNTTGQVIIQTAGANRLLVDATGKVGVVASPNARFHVLEATLGAAVQKYETTASSGDNPNRTSYQNKVLTTDATATVLQNWALVDNTVNTLKARVLARRTGGSAGAAGDSGHWEGTIRAKRTAGGGAVLGTVSTQFTEFDQGWTVAFVANGNGVDLKVTGAVNNNVSWMLVWSELSSLST